MPNHSTRVALPALFVLLLASCGGSGPAGGPPQSAPTVTTHVVASEPWRDSISALGTAQANESVLITAKVTETVDRVNFEDGDLVERGQLLVDLSGRAEVASLEEAAAAYREAVQQFRRAQQLAEQRLIPASQVDTLRAGVESAQARMDAIRARLADRVITAPFAGVLGFRQVSPGTLVTPGTTITSLDDISLIKLDFSVPETFLSALASGQEIEALSAAFPDRTFRGVLRTVGSRVDPVTRAVTARAEIDNPDGELRPGMLLTVRIFKPERQTLVIPEIAVIQVGLDAFVYRVDDEVTARQTRVRLGARRGGEVEVMDGLSAGDRIVVDGTVKLRDGSRITDVGGAASASTVQR